MCAIILWVKPFTYFIELFIMLTYLDDCICYAHMHNNACYFIVSDTLYLFWWLLSYYYGERC
jgi:hypothetical protein